MVKKTLRQELVDGLTALGWVQDLNARTQKYLQFKHSDQPGWFMWVGKAGALRSGKKLSDALPVHERTKENIILAGRKAQ